MTLQVSAAFVGAGSFLNKVETDRKVIEAMWPDAGVLEGFLVSPTTGLNVLVSAGKAVLKGAEANTQGNYFVWNNADETLAWPAPTSLSRIDSLILRAADSQYGTIPGGVQGAKYEIIQGDPNASPVARSDSYINTTAYVPGAWLRLANVLINNGDTTFTAGDITSQAKSALRGAVTICTSSTRPTNPANGQEIFETDTGIRGFWDSTLVQWRMFGKSQIFFEDASFPQAVTVTTGEGVASRITIPAATWARRIQAVSHVYGNYSQVNEFDAILYADSTVMGRARAKPGTALEPVALSPVGALELAASVGVVIELRMARATGTGTINSSVSSGLTRLSAIAVPA
jgi:hypothetical protein